MKKQSQNEKPKSLDLAIMSQSVVSDAKRFVARDAFRNFSFWEELSEREQEALVDEGQQLNAAMLSHHNSFLAIGERLTKVQAILEKSKVKGGTAFTRFLRSFNFSRGHAYRYMAAFRNASRLLPEAYLKGANARGMEILGHKDNAPLGKYSEAYQAVGPPARSNDPEVVQRYLDNLDQTQKEIKKKRREAKASGKTVKPAVPPNPLLGTKNYQLMFNWRNIKNGMAHLSSKDRRSFVDELIGMVMTHAGISSKTTFEPCGIPDEFRQDRGRPRESQKAASASA